ncbi:hypothetical protein CALCODRAFT_437296, partial [Calocera cornea HHB12733]
LARGLGYLHSHGTSPIIHGDIKGNNVLVESREGQVVARLTDFGLAHVRESLEELGPSTTSTLTQGNVRWMAIERLNPEKYGLHSHRDAKTTKSDIFELMRTFYEVGF